MTFTSLWQPTTRLYDLQQRAKVLADIRAFFSLRGVLEVETPLLSRFSVTDPHMDVISTENPLSDADHYFLQSSPEYAMKRLLASGSGPIYQLCKAFRKGEKGSRHNPEFTMLEWYRPGFDHLQLMDEVEQLVASVLSLERAFQRVTYRQLFQDHLGVDPHQVDVNELKAVANRYRDIQMNSDNRDDWLNILLAEIIEPQLGIDRPLFVTDFPVSQAALAKIAVDKQGVSVAQRFELYIQGVELANGYFELADVQEQQKRFQQDQQLREQLGRPFRAVDEYLMAAMAEGLPACAGVALGVDRLLMLLLKASRIDDVVAFPVGRA